jgi:TetR/AcrR family transcriptional regulator
LKHTSHTVPLTRARTRNPGRTQERILEAAFREFAFNGFAGARVDKIARRASINKRMLYHYFGDKRALFREVLRRKIDQRQPWWKATPDDPRESMPYWFELACKDVDWIRLLEWEALHFGEGQLIDEERRALAASQAVRRILRRQTHGHLSAEFDADCILLAMVALTWFPIAFPQLTRLITGKPPCDTRFIQKQKQFLRRLAIAFQPEAGELVAKSSSNKNGPP